MTTCTSRITSEDTVQNGHSMLSVDKFGAEKYRTDLGSFTQIGQSISDINHKWWIQHHKVHNTAVSFISRYVINCTTLMCVVLWEQLQWWFHQSKIFQVTLLEKTMVTEQRPFQGMSRQTNTSAVSVGSQRLLARTLTLSQTTFNCL